MKKILLNNKKGNMDVNVESSEYISLSTKQKMIPTEDVQGVIDHYELYLNERNNCKNYKLLFTIHPYMSNILYNNFTEIVKDEGSVSSFIIPSKGDALTLSQKKMLSSKIYNIKTMKALYGTDKTIDRRYQLIRDTEYSHPKMGDLTYHCGLDIFNNHYLRSDGFFCMKRNSDNKEVFNTIEDLLVYNNGKTAQHKRETPGTSKLVKDSIGGFLGGLISKIWGEDKTDTVNVLSSIERKSHIFNRENFLPFFDAFKGRVKEENGWLGFYNRSYLPTPVGDNITINRCINNKNACDFIDLYPDRSLFSFLPKINNHYYGREEYNWKWYLTYPYENTNVDEDGNKFDFFDENKGLKIIWTTQSELTIDGVHQLNKDSSSRYYEVLKESNYVYFRTKCKHNLQVNDIVKVSYDGGNFSAKVMGIGDERMERKEYYFILYYDELSDEFGEKTIEYYDMLLPYIQIPKEIYVSKLVDNVPCQYYVRKFKVIKDVSSTLNKLAFGRTIFNDSIVQVIYDNNVIVDGLKDNLGRDISEIYFTAVKNNKGYDKYYFEGDTSPLNVEFSHCFGKVTSGFNFEHDSYEEERVRQNIDGFASYNVRQLYNLIGFDDKEKDTLRKRLGLYNIPTPIEDGITNPEIFYGDFVEFSPSTFNETILEDVFHRFNTAQREMKLDNELFNFKRFKYDEIEYDDYDFDFGDSGELAATEATIPDFTVVVYEDGLLSGEEGESDEKKEERKNETYDNIMPEGYFYKPHYRVKLKEYSEFIRSDYDVLLVKGSENTIKATTPKYVFEFTTAIPYKFSESDRIKLLYNDGTFKEYFVHNTSKGNTVRFRDINVVYAEDGDNTEILKDFNTNLKAIFYHSPQIPDYAYYIPDGSGKYVWREVIKDTELTQESDIYNRTYANGAVYINTNINFYLRRQDSQGDNGLNCVKNNEHVLSHNSITTDKLDFSNTDYKTEENYAICENLQQIEQHLTLEKTK